MERIHIERKLPRVDLSFYPWEGCYIPNIKLLSESQPVNLTEQAEWVIEVDPIYEEKFEIHSAVTVSDGKLLVEFPKNYFENAKWSIAEYKVKSADDSSTITWFGGRILLKR